MGDMLGNNLIRKSYYLRLEKTPVQKVPKMELMVMFIINYYADKLPFSCSMPFYKTWPQARSKKDRRRRRHMSSTNRSRKEGKELRG